MDTYLQIILILNIKKTNMLDQLISMGKSQLSDGLKEKFGLNESQKEQTMEVAKSSLVDGIKEQVLGGNIGGVMDLFNGKSKPTNENPIVSSVAKSFVNGIVEKVGVGGDKAKMISSFVVPFLLKKFSSKETGEAKDEAGLMSMVGLGGDSSIGGILGSLGGAKDIMGGLGKFF